MDGVNLMAGGGFGWSGFDGGGLDSQDVSVLILGNRTNKYQYDLIINDSL